MDKIIRLALVVLATARLVRLVTEDSLGDWWVRRPVRQWAIDRTGGLDGVEPEDFDDAVGDPSRWSWRVKLASGIDCRWCVGFWLGVLVLIGEALTATRALRWARPLWTFALSALALNVVANAAGKATHTLP